MKTTIVSVLLVAIIVCICHAQSESQASKHKPNAGFVSDAQTAEDIARFVASQMLKPDDHRNRICTAKLKDGVWTVRCCDLPGGPQMAADEIVIQIRQKTGAIMKYEDPDA
jgi:hypothetical protein